MAKGCRVVKVGKRGSRCKCGNKFAKRSRCK